ncbi:hypothetical protein TrVGV298_009533 [Trichoderma virens]|nr:hypothetical protein TrVGV298_009533 [Trichoderma virens]
MKWFGGSESLRRLSDSYPNGLLTQQTWSSIAQQLQPKRVKHWFEGPRVKAGGIRRSVLEGKQRVRKWVLHENEEGPISSVWYPTHWLALARRIAMAAYAL